jgi:hypothetical protein
MDREVSDSDVNFVIALEVLTSPLRYDVIGWIYCMGGIKP